MIDEWIKKVFYTYSGILLNHKKEWNNTICSNVDGSRDCHTKWSKSDRERQTLYVIAYTWNLKYDTNELYKQTHKLREQRVAKGKGCRGRDTSGIWD